MAAQRPVEIELRRSGFTDWFGDGIAEPAGLLLLPIVFFGNWLTNLLVFRGGWTLHVIVRGSGIGKSHRKFRYRSKAAALADKENQRQLAIARQHTGD
ncbi:hypothetical protein [Kribbella deserti]|uniref:Uncharacterized protein n=1 Tax=Kribbella deserti TaxID=1926257 RepID=A0ABV6QVN5_9ACTN